MFAMKKQYMLLGVLVLVVCAAVYLNINYIASRAENDDDAPVSGSEDNYFSQARETRQLARDESLEILQSMAESVSTSEETAGSISQQISEIALSAQKEGRIENMIIAKGFEDCVAQISGSDVNIVVKTEGLLPSQTAQIMDIVLSEVEECNLKIVGVK